MSKAFGSNKLLISLPALALIAGFLLGALAPPIHSSANMVQPQTMTSDSSIIPVIDITLYNKDGSIASKYIKAGDPPTLNFIKTTYLSWLYAFRLKNVVNGTDLIAESGSVKMVKDWEYHCAFYDKSGEFYLTYPSLKIAIGSGTTPPSIHDYALENKLAEFPVTFYVVHYNSTHMWFTVMGSYHPSTQMTINEVGLFIYYKYGNSLYDWFMLFRDVLPSPLTIEKDQTIVVKYSLYVKYS